MDIFRKVVSRSILFALGWNPYFPESLLQIFRENPRVICIFSHTSAWEFFFLVLYTNSSPEIYHKLFTLVKPSLWTYPLIGRLIESLGGIKATSINRSGENLVESVSKTLNEKDEFILAISPKGQRDPGPWKSGYYYIGQKTDSKYLAVGMDYVTHEIKHGSIVNLDSVSHEDDPKKIQYLENSLKGTMKHFMPLHPEKSEMFLYNTRHKPSLIGWSFKL